MHSELRQILNLRTQLKVNNPQCLETSNKWHAITKNENVYCVTIKLKKKKNVPSQTSQVNDPWEYVSNLCCMEDAQSKCLPICNLFYYTLFFAILKMTIAGCEGYCRFSEQVCKQCSVGKRLTQPSFQTVLLNSQPLNFPDSLVHFIHRRVRSAFF